MRVTYGKGTTEYGPGVDVALTGEELASAVDLWLYAQGVIVQGARTIRYNGELLDDGCSVYVDPGGFVVIRDGAHFSGRGPNES